MGRGKKFRLAVNDALTLIAQFPDGGKPGISGTRRIVVRGFDFAVVYREEMSAIFIYAIASTNREPGYWTERLSDD